GRAGGPKASAARPWALTRRDAALSSPAHYLQSQARALAKALIKIKASIGCRLERPRRGSRKHELGPDHGASLRRTRRPHGGDGCRGAGRAVRGGARWRLYAGGR